ncbi:hypothetical protein AAFF_G00150090, partial [Aldrovandia affinis]
IANHSGYVQVDWKKVEKDVNKAKKHLKKKANKAAPEINSFIEEVTDRNSQVCFMETRAFFNRKSDTLAMTGKHTDNSFNSVTLNN